MNVSIRHLKVFVAIAQLGSFSEAAKSLHLTSPALSLIVKALEEEAGFKVFERTTRSLHLTPAGRTLLPAAHQLIAQHRSLIQTITNIRDQKQGMVRIAATQLLSCTILPPLLTRFRSLWPDVEVVAVDTLFDHVQEMLLRGEVDLGIGPERQHSVDIVARQLFESRLHLVCSTRHPIAGRRSVPWADLKDENVILVERGAAPLMARDSNFQVHFDNAPIVSHFTTALAQVNENSGVVVSAPYVKNLLHAYDVVMVPLVEPRTMRKVHVYRQKRVSLSPAAERLTGYLREALGARGALDE